MSSDTWGSKFRVAGRILVFSLSLGLLLSWLTVPEYVRKGRNLASGFFHVLPEPASAELEFELPLTGVDDAPTAMLSNPAGAVDLIRASATVATGS
jgi:hypothetical protein